MWPFYVLGRVRWFCTGSRGIQDCPIFGWRHPCRRSIRPFASGPVSGRAANGKWMLLFGEFFLGYGKSFSMILKEGWKFYSSRFIYLGHLPKQQGQFVRWHFSMLIWVFLCVSKWFLYIFSERLPSCGFWVWQFSTSNGCQLRVVNFLRCHNHF